DLVTLRCHRQTVDERVVGLAIRPQQELPLRASTRHHARGAWINRTRKRHNECFPCTDLAKNNRASSLAHQACFVRHPDETSECRRTPDAGAGDSAYAVSDEIVISPPCSLSPCNLGRALPSAVAVQPRSGTPLPSGPPPGSAGRARASW